jgi:hypothetical protein
MSANQINVRRKELPESGWSKLHLAVIFAVVILLGAIVTFAVVSFSGGFNYSSAPLEIVADGNRQIIRVPNGGNLQEAINRAKSGDVIELQAGASYNEISLPKKDLTDFITIQSSQIRQLPENVRIAPQQAELMAKIITRGGGKPAVSAENGAHHYRFFGIELAPATAEYTYNLIWFGTESDKLADVPHDLEIDRSYIHSTDKGKTRRGLALNSANTIVKNSYFEGFAFPQEETQGICGWTGTKNVKILNNYIEGGAENVMFGGSDPANAELIPQDIEVRGNHFNKPPTWKGKNSLKCLFELKNAKRVQFIGNFLENNWVGAAFRVTIRNQDGNATFSTVEDVLIKDNILNGSGDGINILGKDDTHPSQTLKNLTVTNNLFLNIGDENFEGGGYFIQIADGENILVSNNTVFNQGNIVTFYGEQPRNFLFRDNITGYGNYGIHGLGNVKEVSVQRLFQNNLFINNRKALSSDFVFPPNNFSAQDAKDVGFANFAQSDFRLAQNSKFRGKGKDKTDLGSNLQMNSVK